MLSMGVPHTKFNEILLTTTIADNKSTQQFSNTITQQSTHLDVFSCMTKLVLASRSFWRPAARIFSKLLVTVNTCWVFSFMSEVKPLVPSVPVASSERKKINVK